jgi:type III secretion system (T3SS) SseB-like protein
MAIPKPNLPPNYVPENLLEELVVSYGKVSPETDAEFYREFLAADIVTLGRPRPGQGVKEGSQKLEADTKFSVRLLEYKGEPVVAIYSSMKRLTDVIPEGYYRETGYIQLSCRTLLQIMTSSDPRSKFALNPGHMVVKTFSPEEVKVLLDGSIFKQLEEARIKMTGPRNIDLPKGKSDR